MESSPHEDGDSFIRFWGMLNFHLPLGGSLAKWGFQIFHFFRGDNRVFSTVGMGAPPPPQAKNLLIRPQ